MNTLVSQGVRNFEVLLYSSKVDGAPQCIIVVLSGQSTPMLKELVVTTSLSKLFEHKNVDKICLLKRRVNCPKTVVFVRQYSDYSNLYVTQIMYV